MFQEPVILSTHHTTTEGASGVRFYQGHDCIVMEHWSEDGKGECRMTHAEAVERAISYRDKGWYLIEGRMPIKYESGMKLWFIPSDIGTERKGRYVIIGKVGRKWAELVDMGNRAKRVAVDSFHADGGEYSSPGEFWASKEEAEARVGLADEWERFYRSLTHLLPRGMTKDKLNQMRRLAGL